MDVVMRPWAGAPRQWIVVFSRKAATSWMNRLPIGRYKHVRAFGYVPEAQAWIFYDVAIDKTTIQIACEAAARQLMAAWLDGADAIAMPAGPERWVSPRLGFWCVQAVKHLIGLRSGALLPDKLWRHCLAQGGEIIANESPASVNPGRSAAAAVGHAGQG